MYFTFTVSTMEEFIFFTGANLLGALEIQVFSLISPPWTRLYFYDSGEVVGEIKVYRQLPYH